MKKHLFLLIVIIKTTIFSQLIEGYGIQDYDSCNFENDCPFIGLDTSAFNIWEIGQPSKQLFNSAYSFEKAIITDSLNPYPIGNNSFFDVILPNIYYTNIIVSFKHQFESDTLIDGGYIECSYDKGATWTNVIYDYTINHPDDFRAINLYGENDTLRGGIPGFSGSSNTWIETKLQWVLFYPVKGNYADTFMLRFHFISDSIETNKDGWVIDDLTISSADLGTGINELLHSNIEIYPNPTEFKLMFDFKSENIQGIELKNFTNQTIQTFKKHVNEIDVSNLAPGLYFLEFQIERGIIRKSFVKE